MDIDHVVIGSPDRDGFVGVLAAETGLTVLDGFRPDGRLAARGVRFAGGPFVDVHQIHDAATAVDATPLLGLSHPIAGAEALALAHGWRVRSQRRSEDPDEAGEPWSILSFRRGQGLLSSLFTIEYHPAARAAPAFAAPLYDARQAPMVGASLRRVWIAAEDEAEAGAQLAALGFRPAGVARSDFTPGSGRAWRGPAGDIVVCAVRDGGCGVVRLDIGGAGGAARAVRLGSALTLVIDERA